MDVRRILVGGGNGVKDFLCWSFLGILIGVCNPTSLRSEDFVDRCIRQLKSPQTFERAEAARQLASAGLASKRAFDPLCQALRDRHRDVRVEAAYALACIGGPVVDSFRTLVPLLLDDDEHVRYSAEWSIANLATQRTVLLKESDRNELIGILEPTVKMMSRPEHQPRNRLAVELALAKLRREQIETEIDSKKSESPPPALPHPEVLQAEALIQKSYEASDPLGRYLWIHRIADHEKYPDRMREMVLEVESREMSSPHMRYAISHWGEAGQRAIENLLFAKSKGTVRTEADSRLVEHLVPRSDSILEPLFDWWSSSQGDLPIRISAFTPLRHGWPLRSEHVERLWEIISDPSQDDMLRVAAIQVIQDRRLSSLPTEPVLIQVLVDATDVTLRMAALDALTTLAPRSAIAATFVAELLRSESPQSPIYLSLLKACGDFGELSQIAYPKLIDLLKGDDSDLRAAAAEAMGKIKIHSPQVVESLIDRLLDTSEEIRVKNRAASSLAEIGPTALDSLVRHFDSTDPDGKESLLRALAIAGPIAAASSELCFSILNDRHQDASLRGMAAHAFGSLGVATDSQVMRLIELSRQDDSDIVRSSTLVAAARLASTRVEEVAMDLRDDPALLVRVSAGFALHLSGKSREGFDLLVAILNSADRREPFQAILRDFGPIIDPWLLEVACDPQQGREGRLLCMELSCTTQSPDWTQLLPLVEDFELGEAFTGILENYWHTRIFEESREDPSAIRTLLTILESQSMTTVARSRLTGLLVPDGLGAGDADEDWKGIALSKQSSMNALREAGQPSAMIAEDESHESSLRSDKRVVDSALMETSPTDRLSETPIEVDLFYGTNRSRIDGPTAIQTVRAAVATSSIGSCFFMLLCAIGFWRNGRSLAALVSILVLAFLTPFSLYGMAFLSGRDWNPKLSYGGEYCQRIEYGQCRVTIPPHHEIGMLEGPTLLQLQVVADPNRHIVLKEMEALSQSEFFQRLHRDQGRKGKNLLVFIHGYNVSFEDAARRTAQMSFDLKYQGPALFYSWPSQSNWYGYRNDQQNIRLSVPQIKEFLLDLANKSGAESINLVAHSMGNVGLMEALKEIPVESEKPIFNQVVLAAPDIDVDVFKNEIAPQLTSKARRYTLYTSKADLALIASKYFNDGPRLGDAGPGTVLLPGLETIDATAVDSSLLGHSYYGSNASVLSDLGLLLNNQPIDHRPYLQRIGVGQESYWAFDPMRISSSDGSPVR